MIAAAAHALNGDAPRAAFWAANVRERNSSLTRDDFYRAFPMKEDAVRVRVLRALGELEF
jgi:predicted deacylase